MICLFWTPRRLAGAACKTGSAPILLMDFRDAAGGKLRLCDFGSAGEGGTPYKSWLKVGNVPEAAFSRSNPLRSARL